MAALHYQHHALRHYQNTETAGAAHYANPHQLIEMLLSGALDRIARARGHMKRTDLMLKIESIRQAYAIVEYLRMQIDVKAGGEVAKNLSKLYDYLLQRLMQANADNDPLVLDEVSGLLREIKTAWDEIPAQYRR